MAEPSSPESLTTSDLVRIGAFSLALFLIVPLSGRVLTGHESVQPETSREMYQGGDWIIPTMGGDPWLERPPIPSWFICGAYAVAGTANSDAVARIAAILAAVPIVLLVAGIGSRLYGRSAGILSGLIFATMQEFYTYASNPEADIFLALIVTAVLAVFVRLELGAREETSAQSIDFFGRRPWLVAAFFALLGATNLAKGVIFGTVMAGLPVAGYLLWNRSWTQIRRYLWLWGWVLAVGVAAAWPLLAISRYPEIVELWKEHYGGRLNSGYLQEPWWYYLAFVPMVILPWTVPALLGLWSTRKAAFAGPGPERFLWCWAIIPPAVFSLSDGKHHHYLLQCLAPWAVLSVVGVRRIWEFCRDRFPGWLREPLLPTAIWGAAAAAVLITLRHKIPGGQEVAIAMGAFVPAAAFVLARSIIQASPKQAFGGVLAVIVAGYAFWTQYQVRYLDRYGPDLAFVREASRAIPADAAVNLQFDWIAPLETFWMLFHSPRPASTIRDPWQLVDRSVGRDCAYILTRRYEIERLSIVGDVTTVLESQLTRNEKDPSERRVLCRVTFRPNIPPPPEEYLRQVRRTLW
jgi:4-amino-4-deoxy-L-arabinose transferase-like glycosyltransferase